MTLRDIYWPKLITWVAIIIGCFVAWWFILQGLWWAAEKLWEVIS